MITSDGSIMSDIDDVISYLNYEKKQHPDWDFDDITGGESEFVDKNMYEYLKNWFRNEYE